MEMEMKMIIGMNRISMKMKKKQLLKQKHQEIHYLLHEGNLCLNSATTNNHHYDLVVHHNNGLRLKHQRDQHHDLFPNHHQILTMKIEEKEKEMESK